MLQQLSAAATGGQLKISHVYLGHIKREDDRKILAHAEAWEWEAVEPIIRAVLETHLYQAIDGAEGEQNFPCHDTGEPLSVAKVASEEWDRTRNQPAVEIMEGIRDLGPAMGDRFNDQLIEFGNTLAYKVMAAGAIKNHLVAALKFSIVPQLGAAAIHFAFATVVDLEDRHESLFDERAGRFVTQDLCNVIKRAKVARAAFFPCLDDEGKEAADLLVYAGSGAGAWFKALEVSPRFSPEKEGKALLRMIAEQVTGESIKADLFHTLQIHLEVAAADGLHSAEMATALEKALGHGIDRLGFQARWESAFGDLNYRPMFSSLFGWSGEQEGLALKIQAGPVEMKVPARQLHLLRQVDWNGTTMLMLAVPAGAKIAVGRDLDMHVEKIDMSQGFDWLNGQR